MQKKTVLEKNQYGAAALRYVAGIPDLAIPNLTGVDAMRFYRGLSAPFTVNAHREPRPSERRGHVSFQVEPP